MQQKIERRPDQQSGLRNALRTLRSNLPGNRLRAWATIVLPALFGLTAGNGESLAMSTLTDAHTTSAAVHDLAMGFRPDPATGRRTLISIGHDPLPARADAALKELRRALNQIPGGLDAIAWCEVSPDGKALAAGIGPRFDESDDPQPNAWIWSNWREVDQVLELSGVSSAIFRSRNIVQLFSSERTAQRSVRLIDLRRADHPIDLPLVREGTIRVSDSGRWAGVMLDGMLVTGVLHAGASAAADTPSMAPNIVAIDGSVNDLALLHEGEVLAVIIEGPTGMPDLAILSLDGANEPVLRARRPGLIQPVWGRAASDQLLIRTGPRGEHPIALLHVARDGTMREEAVGFDALREHPIAISPSGHLVAVRRYARPSGEHHAIRPLRNDPPRSDDAAPASAADITPSLLEPRVLWLSWQ